MTRLRPLLVLSWLLAVARLTATEPSLATVDGEPIGTKEFLLFVAHDRAAIARDCFPASPVVTQAMWTEVRPGGSAADRLRARALSEAVEAKRLQVAAHEAGLLIDADFAAFERGLVAENTRRAQALGMGQPIYGPKAWNESTLYWQRQNLLKARLWGKLGEAGARAKLASLPVVYALEDLDRVPVN